jgi:hypothetical protein
LEYTQLNSVGAQERALARARDDVLAVSLVEL